MSTAQAESQERTGLVDGSQVEALAALLDLDASSLPVRAVPELWHWTHLLDRPAQRDIGPDGHALRGGLLAPPGPDRKRMFAGGRVRTRALLRPDVEATRRSAVVSRTTKEGRSGRLAFVTVRHDYTQAGRLVVSEDADVVYRDATSRVDIPLCPPDRPLPQVDGPHLRLVVDETTLFRFSALTYNAHRIHYDHGWATHEGYPGLVIHGPLQALLAGELLRREGPGLIGHELSYRLVRPAVGPQTLTAVPHPEGISRGARVLDGSGEVTVEAELAPLPTTTTQEDAWQR